MKTKICSFVILSFLALSLRTHAAQTAQVRLYCESVHMQRGTEPAGEYTLQFTTATVGVNSELAPDFSDSPYTHTAQIYFHDQLFEDDIPGDVQLSVPDAGDANHDGFPDFFDVSQGFNALSTSGRYGLTGLGTGSLQASWSRSAGSPAGTCVINFKPSSTYVWKTFTLQFDIFEYRGPLTYTPGTNKVTGQIALTQSGFPDSAIVGPVTMAKTGNTNILSLDPGYWTNAYQLTLQLLPNNLERDPRWPTNFFGYIDFADGDPNSSDPDYLYWTWSIDDTNDWNHNTLPDLGDDPRPAQPSAPSLILTANATNLLLSINGQIGQHCSIQENNTLSATNWLPGQTVVLTNTTQLVKLPLPAGPTRFYRLLLQ